VECSAPGSGTSSSPSPKRKAVERRLGDVEVDAGVSTWRVLARSAGVSPISEGESFLISSRYSQIAVIFGQHSAVVEFQRLASAPRG